MQNRSAPEVTKIWGGRGMFWRKLRFCLHDIFLLLDVVMVPAVYIVQCTSIARTQSCFSQVKSHGCYFNLYNVQVQYPSPSHSPPIQSYTVYIHSFDNIPWTPSPPPPHKVSMRIEECKKWSAAIIILCIYKWNTFSGFDIKWGKMDPLAHRQEAYKQKWQEGGCGKGYLQQ